LFAAVISLPAGAIWVPKGGGKPPNHMASTLNENETNVSKKTLPVLQLKLAVKLKTNVLDSVCGTCFLHIYVTQIIPFNSSF